MKVSFKEHIVIWIRPETRGFSREQVENMKILEDRIRVCCIKLKWFAVGSERLFVSGDSWFSAKTI